MTLKAGLWPSPISPSNLVSGAVGISELVLDGDYVLWAESRPQQGGRVAIMRQATSATIGKAKHAQEVSPASANVRTTVHEYGGGGWWAAKNALWYCDYADQRIYQLDLAQSDANPQALTPEPPAAKAYRYADLKPTPDNQWLVAVMERHQDSQAQPENLLVLVPTDGSCAIVELAVGADFYGSPRLSPDGRHLAWVEWNHPNMPWDETTLYAAELKIDTREGHVRAWLDNRRCVAGGPGKQQAIVQPEWSRESHLHYLSDAKTSDGDRWQLYVEGNPAPLQIVEGELGYPPWVFGLSRYALRDDGSLLGAVFDRGVERLVGADTGEYTAFHAVRAQANNTAWIAASFRAGESVFVNGREIAAAPPLPLDARFLPPPERLQFPTGSREQLDAGSSSESAYALYYAPANDQHQLAPGERAPLIVMAHGGPTSAARSKLNLGIRFWTSRGFGVVDVNYRGSSGFGRAYRKRLDGQWGIVDVEDCVAVARYLVARGDADPERLIIRGGSAGGFTVLCALAFHDTFTAGASLYGVADLESLAGDTHKFESRYLDSLVGPYPEMKERYIARSPIHHLESFNTPMIVLQGSEDKIVPPNQSRMIVSALEERGVTVEYHEFPGEQHGFRQAETIVKALSSELAFYTRLFA